MREYYGRFFRDLWRGLLRFSKEQIAVSLLVGIASAIVGGILGTVDSSLIWRSALVSVVCYGSIFAARAVWGIIVAPINLDRQRNEEIHRLDSELKGQQEENLGLHKLAAAPKVSPLEQERIEAIQRIFGKPPKDQIEVLKCILRHGQVDQSTLIYGSGLSQNAVNLVLNLGISKGIINPAHGKAHIEIKPEFVRAMELYLHGWPGAPPPVSTL